MGLGRFLHRARWHRERLAEMESYVQIETDENIARGMTPEQAREAARRKLGNSTLVREEIYRMNTSSWLDALSRDARYGLRMLRRSPTFTAVALLTLAIGIGANTAVFSVLNSVLLRPLAYPNPNELVSLRQIAPGAAGLANFSDGLRLSPSMYVTYSDHNHTFQSLGVWVPGSTGVTGIGEPEQVRMAAVSGGVLEALGVAPVLGRWLDASDQVANGPLRVMLSYGYWQRRFGGERSVIGRSITVDARPREIVGVMPAGFKIVDADPELILPVAFDRGRLILAGFGFNGLGRLKPGVSIAQADADIARLIPVWIDSWSNGPGSNPHVYDIWRITPALRPLKEDVTGGIGSILWVLMGTIGLVMLMACANVTNLLLVRVDARQQELAVRAALGAGSGRIVRELLLESVLLSVIGGALGIGLAYAGLRLLVAFGPATLPRLSEISMDPSALAFAATVSVLSGLLLGLIPALRHAGPRISTALRSAGRSLSASRERHRTRNVLVVAQVATALVLLVSAGLMIRTFQALRTIHPGFTDAAHLETMRIAIPASLVPEPQSVTRLQNAIVDKLEQIPGVASAAFGSQMPMEGFGSGWDSIFVADKPYRPGELPPLRWYKYVSPGFMRAAGTRMIAGREFTWAETYSMKPAAMVSENLAREIWGDPQAAIGKQIRSYGGMPWHEVVGVVEDVREDGVRDAPPPIVYWPVLMATGFWNVTRTATFVVRSPRAGTESLSKEVRQAVWSVNQNVPVASLQTMQDIYARSLAWTSFTMVMLAITASMALVLGIVGIYGVIAYAVSQRTREIGIRLALGAQQSELKRMFVRSGLVLAVAGAAIGVAASAVLTRLMTSILFGISPLDPATYAAVPVVLIGVAMLASYVPARRASAVDPVEALKGD